MATYTNLNLQSPIASVEFVPVPEGNYAFFQIREGANTESIKLDLQKLGQRVEAQTKLGNHTILVTHGEKSQQEILGELKRTGVQLALPPAPKKPFNFWKARSALSFTGHPLQVASGVMQKGMMDWGTIGFGTLNIVANLTNWIFGAEKRTAPHHLRFLKEKTNAIITPYLAEGAKLPDPRENRESLHKDLDPHKTPGRKFHDFMQRHSVMFGEVGLRYLGGISLAFPLLKPLPGGSKVQSMAHWGESARQFAKGEFKNAYNLIKADHKFVRTAALFWLAGKTLAFTSKVPDPYDPDKPKHGSWRDKLDRFREKYVFKISTVTEAMGATTFAYHRIANSPINLPKWKWIPEHIPNWKIIPEKFPALDFLPKIMRPENAGKELRGIKLRGGIGVPDFIGSIGSLLFVLSFAMRFNAPFGVREVNMEEEKAHVADSLAMVPPEKLPQATAEVAAFLTKHFDTIDKQKKPQFGQIYSDLVTDLYRYHNIALPNAEGGMGIAPQSLPLDTSIVTEQKSSSFANTDLKKPDLASLPRPGSYQDRAMAPDGTALGIGA